MSRYRKRGERTGQWRTRAGPAHESAVPPAAVILDPGLSLVDESPQRSSSDPYNRASPHAVPVAEPGKRRSLDDMRHLSDAIKSAKSWTPPQKAEDAAAAAVARLRANLARMLADIAPLTRSDAEPTHPEAVRALQFRNIAAQLQQLLDCLLKMA
jgi:hypothetical protein